MNKSISLPVFLIILGFIFLFHNLDLIYIPDFFNCSAKLDPIEPVAPKITYFSDIKNFISYI